MLPPSKERRQWVRLSSNRDPDLAFWKQKTKAASAGTACSKEDWETAFSGEDFAGLPEYNFPTQKPMAARSISKIQMQRISVFLLIAGQHAP